MLPIADSNIERVFIQVSSQSEEKVRSDLTKIFQEILTPLYGSQEEALNKIFLGNDRVCHLLYEGKTPVGVIAFKTLLSDEFAKSGVKRSVEIKSLFVVNATNNSGRGLGSLLVDKVFEEVRKLSLNQESIHVTVSETKKESLIFFLNKNFRIVHIWSERYQKEKNEYLLVFSENSSAQQTRALEVDQLARSLNLMRNQDASTPFLLSPRPSVIGAVSNAHWDDIHALKLLSDGTFISGSKDNTLRKWDAEGNQLKIVYDTDPLYANEKNWITAVTVLNDEYWISGERNGSVSLWTTAGKYVRSLNVKRPSSEHISQENNVTRVCCLAAGAERHNPSFFIGFPTIFDEYNFIENRTVSCVRASNNDWVYCIQPLDETRILTVTAGYINLWTKNNERWSRGGALIKEERKRPRNHISTLIPLESSKNDFAVGDFDGNIKILNLSQNKVIREWKEHTSKVWAIENISHDLFASGEEDSLIKLWDSRSDKSVGEMRGTLGGVSALLRLNSNVLISGSCAKDQLKANQGAQLTFYDMRK